MHELSLIQNLLNIVMQSASDNCIKKVSSVALVVGENYGALPDALDFAFHVLTQDTMCAGAALVVQKKPLVLRCRECLAEFSPRGATCRCTYCQAFRTEVVSGRELYIDYYEGE